MASETVERATEPARVSVARRASIWVVLPTYNEAENLEAIARRILASLPDVQVLVVDDNSPDGTGLIADTLSAADPRIDVLHRMARDGLGGAYLAGFAAVLMRGADIVVQMDADGSHNPSALWQLVQPIAGGRADLVIGSRYMPGARVLDSAWRRRLVRWLGSLYAQVVLRIPVHDLTGGYKAWRATTLASIDPTRISGSGYVFQIEMTCRAVDGGARVEEVPIVFRDRRFGSSKMSARTVRQALVDVLRLGLERRVRRRATQARVP